MEDNKLTGASEIAGVMKKFIKKQASNEILTDGGTITDNYGLKFDSDNIIVPRGEWSVLKIFTLPDIFAIVDGKKVMTPDAAQGVKPGDRVLIVKIGNEPVVIGALTRL